MPRWPPGPLGWGRIAIEAAPGAQPHQESSRAITESLLQLRRIVASVKDEQGLRPLRGEALEDASDLVDGNGMGILGRMHSSHVEGSSPTIVRETELSEPLVGPSRDDGLASGVARRMVVVAALRTRFGIAAGPDAAIDSVDRLPASQRVAGQERAEGGGVNCPMPQRRVKASPAAAMNWLAAQVDWGRQRTGGQERVGQFEQGVGAATQASIEVVAEVAQGGRGGGDGVHACESAIPPGEAATDSSPTPSAWLNHKLGTRFKTPSSMAQRRRAASLPVAMREISVDACPQMARLSPARRSSYDTG
jgi:hypothetical protein